MSKTDFDAGDLVLIKEVDPATLKEGDIISFQSPDEANYGEIVTHKIREVTTDEDGNPGFVTYGTTTDSNDQGIVTYNLVIGKYKGHIPNVGTFFQFLKTVPGYFICIFTPFFILILVQARNSIKLFRKYKKEQVEEIQKEKKELEEERLKSQEMMAQLNHSNSNDIIDTSPTYKALEEGSEAQSKEEIIQMAQRQQKFILGLEAALIRIKNKTYGIDRETGELIPKERLRAVPHATLSVASKQARKH